MQLHCAKGNAGKWRLGFCIKCLLRSYVFGAYCMAVLILKDLQHVWLEDTGDKKGDQCLQSHHAVSTPALFSLSHMRHSALGVVKILKAALPVPDTLTIETSFLSSSMSFSFFPFFFFAPCSDVAVGSYLSLPACKRKDTVPLETDLTESTSTAVNANCAHETARQTK